MLSQDQVKRYLYQSSLPREGYGAYLAAWMAATTRYPLGTNIYSRSDEWDVAVVLDACRVDALRTVAPEFDFLTDVGSIRSVGTTSIEWLLKTFTEEHRDEIESTRLVSANPFTTHMESLPIDYMDFAEILGTRIKRQSWINRLLPHNTVSMESFALYDPVWKYRQDTHDLGGVVLPEDLTDRVIGEHRNGAERIVAHYMQPHDPFVGSARRRSDDPTLGPHEELPFDSLRAGEVTREEVWTAYLENLREVLDSVETLLSNVDGRVVITADHGELFGEWGVYSHGPGLLHPALWRVPWVEVTASDEGTYSPSIEYEYAETNEEDLEDSLEALGYL